MPKDISGSSKPLGDTSERGLVTQLRSPVSSPGGASSGDVGIPHTASACAGSHKTSGADQESRLGVAATLGTLDATRRPAIGMSRLVILPRDGKAARIAPRQHLVHAPEDALTLIEGPVSLVAVSVLEGDDNFEIYDTASPSNINKRHLIYIITAKQNALYHFHNQYFSAGLSIRTSAGVRLAIALC